jgi:hypothetical protein
MRTASTHPDKPDKLAQRRYSYGDVEDGLATALDIDDAWRSQFRARIKHHQRLGAIGERSRRGVSVKYSFEQAARLAILFMIADVGLDPILSVQVIDDWWEKMLRRRVRQAVEPGTGDDENPWFLTLRLEAMRGPWAELSAVAAVGAFQRIHHRPPLSAEAREKLRSRIPEEHYAAWLAHWREPSENIGMWLDRPEKRNVCVFPLSHVLHRLKDHLDGAREPFAAAELRDPTSAPGDA